MNRILLIGDPDSLWIKRYVENVLHPAGWHTVIYPIYGWKGGYGEAYARMNTLIYKDEHRLPVIGRIPKVRMWARIYANAASLKALGPFDAIHCHYLLVADFALGQVTARQQNAPLVATFWGSDLLRAEESALRRMAKGLSQCRRISVFNQEHVERIRQLYGEETAAKTVVLDFGEVVFPCIDKVEAQGGRAAAKAHWGIDENQLVVCVGSSASKAQQQLPALEAIAQLDEATLRRITLILQHTYAHDDISNERKVQAFAQSQSTISRARFLPTTPAPRAMTLVSLWSRVILADQVSWSRAQRTPLTLLAAMEAPMPVVQRTMPFSHSPLATAWAAGAIMSG